MRDITCKHPFTFGNKGQSVYRFDCGFYVTTIEFHVILVIDELRILTTWVVMESIFSFSDVVIYVTIDALEEEAWLY